MKNSIFVTGGDRRLFYAAREFEKRGFSVKAAGTGEDDISFEKLKDGISKSEIILLPVPATADGITVLAPFSKERILLSDISALSGDGKIIFGGKIPEGIFGGDVYDLLKRDSFAIANAIPTAEGVLETVMRETEKTVFGSKCLVTGYGKIGKLIARAFSCMGAEVTATARKPSDIALIEAYGYKSAKTAEIEEILPLYDIIINTVPERIISDRALGKIRSDALLVETASKPGGFNPESAEKFGRNFVMALSMPGKVAPVTSGEIICNEVCNILKEPGV